MAYPNPIVTTGALSQVNDIFEYFKGALFAELLEEGWPQTGDGEVSIFTSAPSLPCTRAQFHTWMNARYPVTSTGGRLYTYAEPLSSWSLDEINDWGKVKSIELALFGSVGNGGSTTTSSIFTSGSIKNSVPNWTVCDLNYLRYGLVRFDTYGACHPEISQVPPPTSPVVNTTNRTFNWTNAPGFTAVSDYEYSINGGATWITAPAKPIPVPSDSISINQFLLRTKGTGYAEPSETITNNQPYAGPRTGIVIYFSTNPTTACSGTPGTTVYVDSYMTGELENIPQNIPSPFPVLLPIYTTSSGFTLVANGWYKNLYSTDRRYNVSNGSPTYWESCVPLDMNVYLTVHYNVAQGIINSLISLGNGVTTPSSNWGVNATLTAYNGGSPYIPVLYNITVPSGTRSKNQEDNTSGITPYTNATITGATLFGISQSGVTLDVTFSYS